MTPEQAEHGPCRVPRSEPQRPWRITGAKPNGANPGFIIDDAKGDKYLIKFDDAVQGPRATAADVIVSKIYYAAGFSTPCNRIVFFDREGLRVDKEAMSESSGGKRPLTKEILDFIFKKAVRLSDGRYRASSSLFVEGKPLGPFTYEGTRSDDPNDVVDHEDRRELRGSRLLAAWTNHFDAREQNTFSTWFATSGGRGYVEHFLIDFGDCLGSLWEPPMLGRRIGHSYYFDVGYVGEDFLTLGLIRRPWDTARFGPSGPVFAYYETSEFDPEKWRPGYPNPAFVRMTERDGAWMARTIAQFTDAHLEAVVKAGRLPDRFLERELLRILRGRRDIILRRYFSKLSPLALPRVSGSELCASDLAVRAGLLPARSFVARAWATPKLVSLPAPSVRTDADRVCIRLPDVATRRSRSPAYLIVDLSIRNQRRPGPALFHLYQLGRNDYRLVGLERSDDEGPAR